MGRLARSGLVAAVFCMVVCLGANEVVPEIYLSAPKPGASSRQWVKFHEGGPETPHAKQRTSEAGVVESSATHVTLRVSLPGMYAISTDMADGVKYSAINAPGSGVFETGKPAVPVFGNWIVIPNGTRAKLEVAPGNPLLLEDLNVPPVQPAHPVIEGILPPPFVKNEEIYAADADCPGAFARLEPTKTIRGQQCTILWIYPYQYNPVRKTLAVYPDLSVTVRFQGEIRPLPQHLKSESFDLITERIAPNGKAVLEAQNKAQQRSSSSLDDGWSALTSAPEADYVIITTSTFEAAANKLAAWKERMGFKTEVYLPPSPITANGIATYLNMWYMGAGKVPDYVLIIGDADSIPCNYQSKHPWYDESGVEQGYTGTDLYYATLVGFDYMPDLAIGRLSVFNPDRAMAVVERIISYERDPPYNNPDFFNKVTICAAFQDGFAGLYSPDGIEDSRFVQTSEDLAIFFSNPAYGINKTVNRIYSADPNVNPTRWNNSDQPPFHLNFGGGPAGNPGDNIPAYLKRPNFAWDGNNAKIKAAIESGSFLVTHRDHGGRQKWSKPDFSSSDIQSLSIPSGLSPVIWSVNCQTGWFDEEKDFPGQAHPTRPDLNGDSFSEYLENYCLSGGPVGIIAATRVTDTGYNDRLMWGWTDAIWPGFVSSYGTATPIYRMGDVLNYGKFYMATKYPEDPWRKSHFETYHWFGDPAMEIRTRRPDPLGAHYATAWPWLNQSHDLKVHVYRFPYGAGGPKQPEAGAKVVIIRSGTSSDEKRSEVTDVNGDSTFSGLLTHNSGAYEVVITASNSIPKLGSLQSFQPIAIGAGVDNTDLPFNTGGNAAWFGESITYLAGGGAVQSGFLEDGQSSWFETSVTGAGTLSFWWQVSSEANYDFLEFYIDGVLQPGRISGEMVGWQQQTFNIPTGTHVLRWMYRKDGSSSVGQDCGWVDWISFCRIPDTPSSITYPGTGCAGMIKVSWPAAAAAMYYEVLRSTSPIFIDAKEVYSGPDTHFYDTGLDDGTYYYKVRAADTCAYSNWREGGAITVTNKFSKSSVRSFTRGYYQNILNRAPDTQGLAWWTNEIERICCLGIGINEGFLAVAKSFFNAPEYLQKNKTDLAFVTDLYHTFFQREPDSAGLEYWTAMLAERLTRNGVMYSFIYSPEFAQVLQATFGNVRTRPENNLVNDFYRGLLARFPDVDGYNFWLGQMRNAQCTNAQQVREVSRQIALLFIQSQEYANRNRTNSQFVEDLYDAVLRRGADPGGFSYWVNQLISGATRQALLDTFVNSPEFQGRVQNVIAAGCMQ
jgi:hypothetical protein